MVALAGIRLNPPIPAPRVRRADVPLLGALAAGLLAAAAAMAVPQALLDRGAGESGVASLIAVAQPPLGWTARSLLALLGASGSALIAWAALFLLLTPAAAAGDGAPTLGFRRADAHPDAPPRAPFRAGALGTPAGPGLPVPPPAAPAAPAAPEETAMPADLSLPLSAFDPGAIPVEPAEPVRALPPLPRGHLDPGERIAAVELPAPAPGASAPSIEALLDRLERRVARRVAA